MSNRTALTAVAALSLSWASFASPSCAQSGAVDLNAIQSDIAALEAEISAAESSTGSYEGGALAVISALNLETMRLTKSVLEARVAAEETGAKIEIVVPAVKPDASLADEILADIQTQQANVEIAKAEAAKIGGLMGALALTRYETEKLSLAQLRQAWFRAQYGIAFPTTGAPQAPTKNASAQDVKPNEAADTVATATPDWADPYYPEISYEAEIFKALAANDYTISGWWGIQHSRAELDDTPQVFAINVSDYGTGYGDRSSLKVACIEGEARVIFDPDTFIMGDYQSSTLPVTVRIGDETAVQQRWSKLSDNKGAGLFGVKAEGLVRQLVGKDKVFLRLEGDRGKLHDLSIQMQGSQRVFDEVASACSFSLLDPGREDYKAIQTLLNAAGFDAGVPDGAWGNGSREAMSAYQKSVGLPATGAPDRTTLIEMGILQD